jgi:site-specific DNA-methyltransferase (adenine-specific)
MNIEWVKTKDIIPNENNPRILKDDKFKKLVQSIKDFPEMLEIRPIVVNNEMMILGGNMRLKAIKEIGIKEVPIIKAENLTEEQQREFLIKDNVGFGEWDWDALANDWNPEELNEWGLDLPVDFNETEVDAQEDDFDVPEGGVDTDIVIGDVFDIGKHRLICGDSTQTDTFEKLTEGKLADMVITDPPYNVAYEGKTKDALTIENDNMGDKEFYQFLYDFYTACGAYSKPGGAWYVWHADSEGANFRQAMKDAGIMVKQCLIWVKNSMVMGRQDYQWKHEPCLYGWKEGASHNWYADRKQTTILEFNRPSRNAEHPTMKPIELFAYQISNSSKQGDIVMDAFAGSGTTMVACEQLNRRAFVVEYDPRYCQVIIDRMKQLNPTIKIKRNGVEI